MSMWNPDHWERVGGSYVYDDDISVRAVYTTKGRFGIDVSNFSDERDVVIPAAILDRVILDLDRLRREQGEP